MNYVIDQNGNRKQVPPGYILQNGETMTMHVPMLNMDGAPARVFLADSEAAANGKKVQVGDAAQTVKLADGTTQITFSDGTGALVFDHGYTCYLNVLGQKANNLSLDQRAHMAKGEGGSYAVGALLANDAVGEARCDAAFEGMVADLNKGRYPDGKPPASKSVEEAYQGYLDSLKAWRNP